MGHSMHCVLHDIGTQVNTAEFEEAIQDCSTPIIVDVFAVWCGPVSRFTQHVVAQHCAI